MALDHLDGFEHGVLSTAGGGLYSTIAGTASSVTSPVHTAGGRAVQLGTAGRIFKTLSATSTIAAHAVAMRFPSAPSGAAELMTLEFTDLESVFIRLSTGRVLTLEGWNGSSVALYQTGPTLSVDTWYWLELLVDASTNPWVLKWRVNGVDLTDGSVAQSALSVNNFAVGWDSNPGNTFYFDDWIGYRASTGDFPITERQVRGYSPSGVGTHNLDAATSVFYFKDVGGTETALTTSETTSHQVIDEIPVGSDADHLIIRSAGGGTPQTPSLVGSPGTVSETANNVATPTSLTPGLPTGYATGDTILCLTTCRSATPTVATPSGWTSLLNVTGTNGRIALFALNADGTETGPTVTWSNLTTGTSGTPAQARCAAFHNLNPTLASIVDVTGTVENGAASTTVVAGGANVTTTVDNDLVLSIGTRLDDTGGTWTAGSGFTIIGSDPTTSGVDKSQGWQYQVKATAGAVTVPDFGVSGSSFASSGVAVALKSATISNPTTSYYVEYAVADSSETVAPLDVRTILALRNESGTVANKISAKLRANGNDGAIFTDLNIASATTIYKSAVFATAPGGAAWTDAIFDGATIRWGYTDDPDAPPRLEGVVIEAAFPVVVTNSLAGTVDAVSTVTGTATRLVPLAGVVAASSTVTGDLTNTAVGSNPLEGVVAGSSAVTGSITVVRPLAGTVAATSTVTGQLVAPSSGYGVAGAGYGNGSYSEFVAGAAANHLVGVIAGVSAVTGSVTVARPLTGVVAGSSTVTGVLTVQPQLAGVVAGVSTAAGVLTGAARIAGVVAGQSTVTGVLAVSKPLAGVVAGVSTVTGTLTNTPPGAIALAGTIAGASTVTGVLTVQTSLAGIVAAASTATGVLTSRAGLVGIAAGVSTVTGSMMVGASLAGTVAGVSTVTGSLTNTAPGANNLVGTVAGASTVTGSLLVTKPLAGIAAASSTVTGSLGNTPPGTVAIAGTVAASSLVTGALTVSTPLAGTAAATSSATASLTVRAVLAGTAAAQSTAAAGVSITSGLQGAIAATSSVTAAPSVVRPLVGSSAAVSTVAGALTSIVSLRTVLVGQSTVVGRVTVSHPLAGVIFGGSSVTGTVLVVRSLSGAVVAVSGLTGSLENRGPVTPVGELESSLVASVNEATGHVRVYESVSRTLVLTE